MQYYTEAKMYKARKNGYLQPNFSVLGQIGKVPFVNWSRKLRTSKIELLDLNSTTPYAPYTNYDAPVHIVCV